jgi:hypothetical protein
MKGPNNQTERAVGIALVLFIIVFFVTYEFQPP